VSSPTIGGAVQRFESLENWIDFLTRQGDIPFLIAGNKDDLAEQAEVTPEVDTFFARRTDLLLRKLSLRSVAVFNLITN
jgi:GTPase SAR1 family protein